MLSPLETDYEQLALSAYVKLMRAAESVTLRAHRHLAEAGLTPTQFGVLEALHHLGPLCQRDIGRKILKSSGNITTVIDNLEKRGLVVRRPDRRDRRFVRVTLTAAGETLIARIFPRHAAGIAAEMEVLDEEDLHDLARLCRRLGLGEREGSDPIGAARETEAQEDAS